MKTENLELCQARTPGPPRPIGTSWTGSGRSVQRGSTSWRPSCSGTSAISLSSPWWIRYKSRVEELREDKEILEEELAGSRKRSGTCAPVLDHDNFLYQV